MFPSRAERPRKFIVADHTATAYHMVPRSQPSPRAFGLTSGGRLGLAISIRAMSPFAQECVRVFRHSRILVALFVSYCMWRCQAHARWRTQRGAPRAASCETLRDAQQCATCVMRGTMYDADDRWVAWCGHGCRAMHECTTHAQLAALRPRYDVPQQ